MIKPPALLHWPCFHFLICSKFLGVAFFVLDFFCKPARSKLGGLAKTGQISVCFTIFDSLLCLEHESTLNLLLNFTPTALAVSPG